MIRIARVTADVLDVGAHLAAVRSSRTGAVALFIGQVRDHDPEVDGRVVGLDYTAHPDAETMLRGILVRLAEAADGDTLEIAVSHRIGNLDVGDDALVVAVASAHRAEAFAACREIVERIKTDLPVWKRQWQHDGASAWVGL
ncbi:molybdenum cofactor biosynthesis protein MoaE [Agromyces intestinalis]|uniref:Molybdenum cofactor biosynthesis protein MoaE n=1 Tax=Agromyces intestinalis TaxID=2592652 RepID=A0A5C1YDJ4_9MICO|nr:molybdenum cofactor biosynthesis protein MoaE [Agromyces intestinalis]QEO13708.1 molybdenum cofactor biosynthesis protein MoaE [Agromyces intestinalis]